MLQLTGIFCHCFYRKKAPNTDSSTVNSIHTRSWCQNTILVVVASIEWICHFKLSVLAISASNPFHGIDSATFPPFAISYYWNTPKGESSIRTNLGIGLHITWRTFARSRRFPVAEKSSLFPAKLRFFRQVVCASEATHYADRGLWREKKVLKFRVLGPNVWAVGAGA